MTFYFDYRPLYNQSYFFKTTSAVNIAMKPVHGVPPPFDTLDAGDLDRAEERVFATRRTSVRYQAYKDGTSWDVRMLLHNWYIAFKEEEDRLQGTPFSWQIQKHYEDMFNDVDDSVSFSPSVKTR